MASLFMRRLAALTVAVTLGVAAPAVRSQADVPLPNPPQFPFENPLLPDQDTLGKFLFWEEQLSHDGTMACGTCHIHEFGGSDPRSSLGNPHPGPDGLFGTADDVAGSPGVVRNGVGTGFVHDAVFGVDVQVTPRKAPTTINSVYFTDLFWDGRATQAFTDPQTGLAAIGYLGALESQAADPPASSVEMGADGIDWDDIALRIRFAKPGALMTDLPPEMADFLGNHPTYPSMFNAVYGDPAVTSERILFAIGNYERTLISDQTALDDFLKGVTPSLPPEFQPGFDLFQGAANCSACHVLPFAMDNDYHNIGVRPDAEDIGRQAVTGMPADIARFKTPQIRNAALRGNLMHNGGLATVRDVIEFYDRGGDFPGPNLDVNIQPLNLTPHELDDLEHFVANGMLDARVANNVFPFSRPTLHSELASLNFEYGVASLDGSGGTAELIGHQPGYPNHKNFTVGVSDAVPNTGAIVLFSLAPDLAATPFPNPAFPVPMNIDLGTIFLDVITVTDGAGVSSFRLPLPNNPSVSGITLYVQWFIGDPTAVATGGVYGTKGLAVEIL